MHKILTIVGTRPQFIKANIVSNYISNFSKNLIEYVVHTGQHYDKEMSDYFCNNYKNNSHLIKLNINQLPSNQMIGRMLLAIDLVIKDIKPDLILLYGDTNSTLSGALAASKQKIKIAHVEGGLRNFDLSIPEDVNRILTDRISDIIFYSTDTAYKNLISEGFHSFPCKLVKTDDLLSDAVLENIKTARRTSNILSNIFGNNSDNPAFTLVTIHREKSLHNKNIKKVVDGINRIADKNFIIFPIHPNTKNIIESNNVRLSDKVLQISPVNYIDMLKLIDSCNFVVTDSGGIQREAYILKKKSLLILGYTPWEELVESKCAITVGLESDEILNGYKKLSKLQSDFNGNFYGTGKAAQKIVNEIISLCNGA